MSVALDQLRILLVEPSDVQRKVISQHLNQAGLDQTRGAASISEAKQLIQSWQPDIVTSAMYFADGTGHELIEHIHQNNLHDTVHFMLVSSEHRADQLEQFKQSGIVAILPKPFTPEQLQKAIKATVDLLEPEHLELDLYDIEDLRVLVVDDSSTSRHVLRRVLENMGVEHCVEAENGQQAIDILSEQQFDLIVTDFHMPEVNGSELAQYVRNHSAHSHTPMLMVTARANEPQLANVKQSGIDALTDKPFEPETLRKILSKLLSH
ncbi:response regulator [Idiomarina aquatica]|jgi:two-component system chemotaxis response regulator CheY|uniref:Two-component system response regulator n=1 Tax=Idiomarina aquatica TaxID=1327752 RepID=A0AA94EDW4_9GAMM|nr:response regulator [Idiomarina aquatica]RUO43136.1 two-component system response regulator [Idiomarina aquatica]